MCGGWAWKKWISCFKSAQRTYVRCLKNVNKHRIVCFGRGSIISLCACAQAVITGSAKSNWRHTILDQGVCNQLEIKENKVTHDNFRMFLCKITELRQNIKQTAPKYIKVVIYAIFSFKEKCSCTDGQFESR